jgi:hypothetical protein
MAVSILDDVLIEGIVPTALPVMPDDDAIRALYASQLYSKSFGCAISSPEVQGL